MMIICRECKRKFRGSKGWTMCPECIAEELTGGKTKEKTDVIAWSIKSENIENDAKMASELGLSYGQYMAERRTGRI